jgi:adenylate cyclase
MWGRHNANEASALKAIEIDPDDADAQAVLALATMIAGNRDEALERTSLALTSNPNSPSALGTKGLILHFSGCPAEGREALLTALRLNPRDPRNAVYMCQIASSYYLEHDYDSAVEAARRSLARFADFPHTCRWLAAALGQLGRTAEAQEVLHKIAEKWPQTVELLIMRSKPPYYCSEDHEHMLNGLRKAGLRG